MVNPYELADYIEDRFILPEAANMLRQQADKLKKYELRNQEQVKRIAELEKDSAWWKSQYEQMCRDFQYYKGKHDQEIKRQEDWEKATRERGKYGIY